MEVVFDVVRRFRRLRLMEDCDVCDLQEVFVVDHPFWPHCYHRAAVMRVGVEVIGSCIESAPMTNGILIRLPQFLNR